MKCVYSPTVAVLFFVFFFLFSFLFFNSLRAKQIAHDTVMDSMRAERDQHRDHKYHVIYKTAERSNVRRWLRQWKSNVDDIHGVRTVHQKLSATQEALREAQENARSQHQVIERLRGEIDIVQMRNEMLEIVNGGVPPQSVRVGMMGTPGRSGV